MLESKLNHEAIEAYADSFSLEVCNSFFDKKEAISGKEIVEVTPVKQVNYFVLKILFRQWQKETLRLQSPYFNYRHEDVRKALIGFMNTLSQQISIRRDHFFPLLKQATRESLLLIISPYDFFREELTGHESGRLNDKYLKNSDKYIKINRHLFEVYKSRFEALGEGDMEHEDALALLDDIFMSMDVSAEEMAPYESKFNEVIETSFSSFRAHEDASAGFDEQPATEEHETIEDETFDEPELANVEPTGRTPDDDEPDDPDDDDEDIDQVHKEVGEEMDDLEDQSIEDEFKTLDQLGEEKSEEPVQAAKSAEPFQFFEKDAQDEEEDQSESALNKKFTSGKLSLHEQLKAEKGITLAELHQSQKVESIVGSITVNQKYMFVNELFKGEDAVFIGAMVEIERCTSFDEAVEMLIQGYSKDLEWDMNAPQVKELLKVIFKKFR